MEKRTFSGAGTHACRAPLVALLVLAYCLTSANAESPKRLALHDALSRALAADFAVPAARARIRGAEAGVRQAGRLPAALPATGGLSSLFWSRRLQLGTS